MYRVHPVMKKSVLSADEKDPLTQKDRCGFSGIDIAMKKGKHERAIILLKVSKCMNSFI